MTLMRVTSVILFGPAGFEIAGNSVQLHWEFSKVSSIRISMFVCMKHVYGCTPLPFVLIRHVISIFRKSPSLFRKDPKQLQKLFDALNKASSLCICVQ